MKQKKEKTTILFVNKNQHSLKPIQVSSRLLLNWKKYFAGLTLLFLSLIGTIVYLTSNSIQQYKLQETLSKKLSSMHSLFAQFDTSAMREKFAKIDKDLITINGFLKARGIQTAFKGPQGGEVDNVVVSTNEI